MNTPPATYRHKTIVLLLSCIVGLLFLSSCEKLGIGKDFKCRGCPEEQPWGAYGEDYCYPTEEACQQDRITSYNVCYTKLLRGNKYFR